MKKLYFLFFALLLFSTQISAQEVCANGIDDDADDLIDCYDPDCACDNSFYVSETEPPCQFMPPVVPTFTLQELYRTNVNMDARQNPSIGDVDGDGINEIVAHDDETTGELYVFDGVSGALEATITDAPRMDVFFNSPAIGDADGDGIAEIYVTASNLENDATQRGRIIGFEYNPGTMSYDQVMVSATVVTGTPDTNNGIRDFDRATPALADFNEDGIAEVYAGNQIWDVRTGAEVAFGGVGNSTGASNNNAGTSGNRFEPMPVAADVLPDNACANCSGLELVAGNEVYSVNLGGSPSMNIETSISGSSRNDGLTSIADFDQDGDLDGIILSQGRVYVWDLQTNAQIGSTFRLPSGDPTDSDGFTESGGRLNVADFDGDGSLEIGTAGEDIYVVIDNDMTLLWDLATQDGSQKTGSTVFDFEADGVNEVVYRDELNLYILNGTNGNVISQLGCTSATRLDYPVVADVNQDGQTEIICACNGNNGDIVVFNSSDQPWVQSRPVWNQHTYHNTQINDDMTFDTEWQDHSLVASGLINTFLAQATYATYDGNPLFAAPDAEVSISTVTGADCALTDDYTIEFVVTNKAAASLLLPAGTPVSFYDGNPFNPGATYLGTEVTTINLPAGNSETLTTTVNSATSLFNLYAVANDNGTGTLPLMQPTTNIGECDYTDNLSNVQAVNCDLLPVELTNFSVDLENGRAVLAWETASELNNDFFEVQRSKEGSQFQVIGRVEGNGTTDQASSYSFIDPLLNQGDNYYRLRQVDFDGSQEYSTIEYVFLPSQEEVRLLFNPVSGFIQLTIGKSVASKRTDYEIYNTIGQTVLRGRLEGNQIEISELVPGNYFLRLVTTEGRYTLPFTVK